MGKNMNKIISYGRQTIDEDDIMAVVEVFRSDFLTQGPKVSEFERSLCDYCESKYAVVFSSGTSALHGAYFAAGLGFEDEIITSPMTFLATANAALFLGAKPVFVDVKPASGNIDIELIEEAITKKTKAIVPIHYGGHPVQLERISQIARDNNLIMIEDACHALGAEYNGIKIGSCKFSDMVTFSFHPVKSITTGEGGAVLTDDEVLFNKLLMFRQHGVTKDPSRYKAKKGTSGQWYYEMQHLGYNYRITDIQAALGISQLRKLDDFIAKRRSIAQRYNAAFANSSYFDMPIEEDGIKSAWHLFPIRLKDKFVKSKIEIFSELRKKNLWVQVHYIPVHLQPYYQDIGYKRGCCPNAEDFYSREISIPMYPAMSDEDVEYVIENIIQVFKKFV